MKIECSVVRDLLPLCVEEMASKETEQLVNDHLKECPECRAEFESLKAGGDFSTAENKPDTKPFKIMMKRMNRQFYSLAYAALIFLIFLGFGWTAGENLMYNSFIMPIVGIFGYYVFEWKAVYKVPALLLLIDLAVFAFQLIEINFADTLSWTLIYAIFVLIGIAIAFLLHFAFKKGDDIKKRIIKISAFCLAILMTAGVCWFANGLVGNPISKMLAKHTASSYIEDRYANTDYEIQEISYSFKDSGYYAHIVSPKSMDGNFTLRISMLGKLKNDDYASRVTGHVNVANRLFFEYRDMVDAVLNSYVYPYTVDMAHGRLEFDREVGEEEIEGAIKRSELVNDKFYNIGELGKKNGQLVLYINSDTVTKEKAAEILLKTRELLDQSGISFYSVHFVLQYHPYDANKSYDRPEGKIDLKDFLYSDIYEEGLIERIEKSIEDTRNYYAEKDKNK